MVFRKYTYKNGKRYGPYYYENKRVGDQIVTTYIGKDKPVSSSKSVGEKNHFVTVSSYALIILLAVSFIFIFSGFPTGNAVLNIDSSLIGGETIRGDLNFVLQQGELIPEDSIISFSLGNQSGSFLASEIFSGYDLHYGKYYVTNVNLGGEGYGYGLPGVFGDYPEVEFSLRVFEDSSDIPSVSGGGGSGGSEDVSGEEEVVQQVDSEEEVNASSGEIISEDSDSEIDGSGEGSSEEIITEETSSEEDISEEVDVNIDDEDSSESGVVVSDSDSSDSLETESGSEGDSDSGEGSKDSGESESSSGSDSGDDPSSSDNSGSEGDSGGSSDSDGDNSGSEGESSGGAGITGLAVFNEGSSSGETERIVSGSVRFGEEFSFDLSDGEDYEIIELTVLGEDIEDSYLNVDLSDGVGVVTTSYGSELEGFGEEYLGDERYQLDIDLEEFNLIAEDGSLDISLSYEDNEIVSLSEVLEVSENVSYVNKTEEIVLDDNFSLSNLSKLRDIPLLRIPFNGNVTLNLSEYFYGAESYSFEVVNITGEFNGEILELRAQEGFGGARQGKVVAYSGNYSVESNLFTILVSSGAVNIETIRNKIVVGKPVSWKKNITINDPSISSLSIELPKDSFNISVKSSKKESSEIVDKNKVRTITGNVITGMVTADINIEKKSFISEFFSNLFGSITGFAVYSPNLTNSSFASEEKIEIILDEGAEEYLVEYYTTPPVSKESDFGKKKEVIVSGPDNLGYTDVIASANLTGSLRTRDPSRIEVIWKNYSVSEDIEIKGVSEVGNESVVESSFLLNDSNYSSSFVEKFSVSRDYVAKSIPFDVYDLDFDGYYDYVEWVVPHLSNQTFEIILITKAEHLNETRDFVEDVYDYVGLRDNNYTSSIPVGHFVRVSFERNLTSKNDITLYARSSGIARIDVYEKDGLDVIATFDNISSDEIYKVYLSGLDGEQDVFDLEILDSGVEFDYIVDPAANLLDGLVSYYHLEESTGTRVDEVSGNNLGEGNTVGNVAAVYNNGADIDSTTDYLLNNTFLTNSSNFTVSFWVKDIPTTPLYTRILEFKPGGVGSSYGLIVAIETSTQIDFATRNGGNYGDSGSMNNVTTHYSSGKWVHFVAVVEDLTLRVYQNGSIPVTADTSAWSSAGSQGLALGSNLAGSSGSAFDIDEVALWNRSLTTSEVSELWNNGDGLFYPFTGDMNPPLVQFINPSPSEGESVSSTVLNVSTTSTETGETYTLFGDSLVGWYRLDNDSSVSEDGTHVYDWSGNDNNGTVSGAIVNSSGKFGGSFSFDGSSDEINLGQNFNFDPDDEDFSFGGWLKCNTGVVGSLITKGDASSRQYHIFTSADRAYVYVGQTLVDSGVTVCGTGLWHHVLVAVNSSGASDTFIIYVDGVSANSGTPGSTTATSDTQIGSRRSSGNTGYGAVFSGSLDEVVLFNRTLSLNEVQALYNSSDYYLQRPIVGEGGYNLTTYAVDSFGNINYTSRSFTINSNDVTPPLVQFISPSPSEGGNVTSATLNVSTSDSDGETYTLLDDGLVGWWRFDNDSSVSENDTYAYDWSENNNNATLIGPTLDSNGSFGNSYYFDGSDYGQVSSMTIPILDDEGAISIWVKSDNSTQTNTFMFNKVGASTNRYYFKTASGSLYQFCRGNPQTCANAGSVVGDSVWHHLVGIWNTTTISTYVDGVYGASADYTGVDTDITDFYIGGSSPTGNLFNGSLDEFVIYNRTLSISEIKALYNSSEYYSQRSYSNAGNYNVTAYTVDSSGNMNYTSRSFIIDKTPTLESNFKNDFIFTSGYGNITVFVGEEFTSLNYSIDGGENISLTRYNNDWEQEDNRYKSDIGFNDYSYAPLTNETLFISSHEVGGAYDEYGSCVVKNDQVYCLSKTYDTEYGNDNFTITNASTGSLIYTRDMRADSDATPMFDTQNEEIIYLPTYNEANVEYAGIFKFNLTDQTIMANWTDPNDWGFAAGIEQDDDYIYACTYQSSSCYSFYKSNMSVRWSTDVSADGFVPNQPLAYQDYLVVPQFSGGDESLKVFNKTNGSKIWSNNDQSTGLWDHQCRIFQNDDHLWCGGYGSATDIKIYNIGNGSTVQTIIFDENILAKPILYQDKVFIVTRDTRNVSALNYSDPAHPYIYTFEIDFVSSNTNEKAYHEPQCANEICYIATNDNINGDDGMVLAFNATDGSEIWRYESTTYGFWNKPAITDGIFYLKGESNSGGRLLAFGSEKLPTYFASFSGLSNGAHTVEVFAENSGSVATLSYGFTLLSTDTTLPLVQFIDPSPSESETVSSTTVNVSTNDSESNETYTFLDDGSLQGWWRFDKDSSVGENDTYVLDWSGNGRNGTITNGATYNSSGAFDGAFSFNDASSQYIDLGHIDELNLTNNDGITISTWFRYYDSGATIHPLVSKGNFNSGTYYLDVYNNQVRGQVGGASLMTTSISGEDNKWKFATLMQNSTGQYLFVDGQYATSASANAIEGSIYEPAIGKRDSTFQYFEGDIDEVLIFNRSLSQEEILSLYNSTNRYVEKSYSSGGNYNVTAYAVDDSGNMNQTSRSFSVLSGTAITSPETDITSSGYYILTGNISCTNYCINVTASDVIIDGKGYNLTGNGGAGKVIMSNDDAVIKNVTVKDFGLITGFENGIYFDQVHESNIENNTFYNIYNGNTYAIYMTDSNLTNVHNNNITWNSTSGTPYGFYALHSTLSGSFKFTNNYVDVNGTVNSYGVQIFDLVSGGANPPVQNYTVSGNQINGFAGSTAYGIYFNAILDTLSGFVVEDNVLDLASSSGVYAVQTSSKINATAFLNNNITLTGNNLHGYFFGGNNNVLDRGFVYASGATGSSEGIYAAGLEISNVNVTLLGGDPSDSADVKLGNSKITNSYLSGNTTGIILRGFSGNITNVNISAKGYWGIYGEWDFDVAGTDIKDVIIDGAGIAGVEINSTTVASTNDLINVTVGSAPTDFILRDGSVRKYDFNGQSLLIYDMGPVEGYGHIRSLGDVTADGSDLASEIIITNNSAYVDSVTSPGLNFPANITFVYSPNGFSEGISILKDGSTCTDCYNFTGLTEDVVQFNVTGFSNYTLGQESGDFIEPLVQFINPSPSEGEEVISATINVSTNDTEADTTYTLINKGLAAWYRFDKDIGFGENDTYLYDWSGNDNHGTIYNGATYNTTGIFGDSYYFDNSDDNVSIPDSQSLNASSALTVSVWIKPTTLGSDYDTIVAKTQTQAWGTGQFAYGLRLSNTGIPQFGVNTTTGITVLSGSSALLSNQLYHLVGIYDGSTVSLYINGVLNSSTSRSGTINRMSSRLSIGDVGNDEFNGLIDELIIFNESISSSEVEALYNSSEHYLERDITDIGDYNITAYAVDASGNMNYTSRSFSLVLDDVTPPLVQFIDPSPSEGEGVVSANVNVSTSDSQSGEIYTFLNDGLVGWWRFENTSNYDSESSVYDWSGNDRNGTVLNTVYYNSSGKFGGSMTFPETGGTRDWINLSTDSAFDLQYNENMTISFWFQSEGKGCTSNNCKLLSNRPASGSPPSFTLQVDGNTASFKIEMMNGATTTLPTYSGNYSDYQWHHAVAIFVDGGSNVNGTFYLDGSYAGSALMSGSMNSNDSLLIGGCRICGTTEDWQGNIDDMMIWKNRTLSSSEVQALYNSSEYYVQRSITKQGSYNLTAYAVDESGNINYTSRLFTVGGDSADCSEGCFIIRDTDGNNITIFDKNGTLNLKGNYYSAQSTISEGTDNEFIIRNSTGGFIAALIEKGEGNLNLTGSVSQFQTGACSPPERSFVIRNSSNDCVSYIDSNGNLWLKGGIKTSAFSVLYSFIEFIGGYINV